MVNLPTAQQLARARPAINHRKFAWRPTKSNSWTYVSSHVQTFRQLQQFHKYIPVRRPDRLVVLGFSSCRGSRGCDLLHKEKYPGPRPKVKITRGRDVTRKDRSSDPIGQRWRCSESVRWKTQQCSMCRHIINAKVSIQTPCCKKWYECPECHDERENHSQRVNTIVAFTCKTCRKIFFKDLSIYGAQDSACPQCGTVFVLPAVTPEARVAELALSILGAEASTKISKF